VRCGIKYKIHLVLFDKILLYTTDSQMETRETDHEAMTASELSLLADQAIGDCTLHGSTPNATFFFLPYALGQNLKN